MSVQRAYSPEVVWKLYMAESMTFEQVAEMDFNNLVEIVFCDFNVVPMERARSIAVICRGLAIQKLREAQEEQADAEERRLDEYMQAEEEYYDRDELFALAHPGALM